MPRLPGESEDGGSYDFMQVIGKVIRYSGEGYRHVMALPYDVFMLMVKHVRIEELMQTDEGRQYLMESELMSQDEPDLSGLRTLASSTGKINLRGGDVQ